VVIPTLVFVLSVIALLWLRRLAYGWFERWLNRRRWPTDRILSALRVPSVFWSLLLGAYLGMAVSSIPPEWKSPVGKGLWTLLVVTVTISLLIVVRGLVQFYGLRHRLPWHAIVLIRNTFRVSLLVVAMLVLLGIWGVPVTPLLLLVLVAILAAVLAFRDAVPNIIAGFQLGASQQIKAGDYIKLETGEEGYVTQIGWRNTLIKGLDESTVTIPNSRLVQKTVVNYGHPLKRAQEPFRFYSRTHLTELTGLKAKNLRELADILKTAPESVVYYHTHRFLEVHHYLTPEPSNDFGIWVSDALGDQILGERLSSVDTFAFPTLGALRERLVGVTEEYLAGGQNSREAMPGREFYFMKSVSVILPTPYLAHDLREFVETLRKISVGSLYFHIFESRLRLGKGLNDFSTWLQDSLGESELGQEIARLDPYTFTLEGLRSALIRLIEKRIK
jgi:small-conductance mechanosensitive channel